MFRKLIEIDKLKILLLTDEQRELFDYIPKPSIVLDPQTQVKSRKVSQVVNMSDE